MFAIPILSLFAWRLDDRANVANIVRHRKPLVVVGVLAGVSQTAFIAAVTHTAVANVVTIVASAPIVAALVGWTVFGERVGSRVWTAIGVTVIGIVVVVAGSFGSPTLDGDLLAVLAIVAFGISINVWRRYPDMSVFVGLALSAVFMLVVSAFFAHPLSLEPRAYWSAIGMGMVFNPLGRICHASAPRYAPAAEVALFTPLETIAASIWAWWAFSEQPPTQTVVGATIIILGVVYGTISQFAAN